MFLINIIGSKINNESQKVPAADKKTGSCTKRMIQSTMEKLQRYIKWARKDCILFGRWLSSKKLAEAAMEFVADLIDIVKIDIVKTNTEVFCKETTEQLKKYWTGGSYLILKIKPMVPRFRSIIDIGCKYNVRKVLSFLVTDNTGITQAVLAYLYKYPDQFYNVSIFSVARPLFMYNYFGPVNEVDSHNKSRQYYMVLGLFWVNWCCLI